jgi:NifU-like protein involved in Fe-S cluster formation
MTAVCPQTSYGPSPIPQEGRYDQVFNAAQISGLSHSAGTCAMKQGACKLTINVKKGVIWEALVEVVGCSGMTQSAMMASEILPGRTLQEALNTDLVCDAINVAMREIFLNISYGRTQTAFTKDGLAVGSAFEDLGNGYRSQLGTGYGSATKGPRYLEVAEGYITKLGLDEENRIIGYEYVNLGKMMDLVKDGEEPASALTKAGGVYGRFNEAARTIDPRKE